MSYTLCRECGQPIRRGRHKPDEYRHAQGCPRDYSKYRTAPRHRAHKPHPLHIDGITGRMNSENLARQDSRGRTQTEAPAQCQDVPGVLRKEDTMSHCPQCGRTSAPCPETGYDGEDFCSAECEEKAVEAILLRNEVIKILFKAVRLHAKKEENCGTDTNRNSGN